MNQFTQNDLTTEWNNAQWINVANEQMKIEKKTVEFDALINIVEFQIAFYFAFYQEFSQINLQQNVHVNVQLAKY